MQGGTDHASHRLAAVGLSGREIALVAYAAQIVCSTIAVVTVNLPELAVPFAVASLSLGLAVVAMVVSRARRTSG